MWTRVGGPARSHTVAGKFLVFVNHHAIVQDGDSRVFNQLAVPVISGSCKFHIVGLLGQGRKTHVHRRRLYRVDSTTLVISAF